MRVDRRAATSGSSRRKSTHAGIAPRSADSAWAETPLDDWIFAPDHAIPLLENHFGVLSLEGFGLAGKPAAASAAGAILYYIRSTQRGTLDHMDRIGFYERQNCLVLDAVTVRNLELIEPLFAGNGRRRDSVPLPRCDGHADGQAAAAGVDAAAVAWSRAEIEGRLDAVEVQVKDTVAARRVAAGAGRDSRSGAAAEPGNAGDGESARCAGAGGFAGANSAGAGGIGRDWPAARLGWRCAWRDR